MSILNVFLFSFVPLVFWLSLVKGPDLKGLEFVDLEVSVTRPVSFLFFWTSSLWYLIRSCDFVWSTVFQDVPRLLPLRRPRPSSPSLDGVHDVCRPWGRCRRRDLMLRRSVKGEDRGLLQSEVVWFPV